MKIKFVSPDISRQALDKGGRSLDSLDIYCRPIFYDYDPTGLRKTLAFDTEYGQIHVELNPRELVQLALKCLQQHEGWNLENFGDDDK